MAQALRGNNGTAQPAAYWETLRDRIQAGIAVDNLNAMIGGTELPLQQERTTLFVVNKILPNIAAISVEVSHRQATSIDDLRNRAEALGVDPATLLSQVIDSTAEKVESTSITSDTPIPRDVVE